MFLVERNDPLVVVAALVPQEVMLHVRMINRVLAEQVAPSLSLGRVLCMAAAVVVAALVPQVHLQQLVQAVLAVAELVAEFAE